MNVRIKMGEAFSRIFNRNMVLTDEMTASDVPEWDSLTHISLIIEIEDEFNLKFTVDDIADLKNVGEMISMVERKLSSSAQ